MDRSKLCRDPFGINRINVSADDLKLGLVGTGRWGTNLIRTIANTPGISLHHIVVRNAELGQQLSSTTCRIHENWSSLFDSGTELDGLVLAVPPDVQVQIGRVSLRAGIPTMFEKPLALCTGDATMLLELAERRNTPVLVNHVYLYNSAYRKMRAKANSLGRPKSIVSFGGADGPIRSSWSALWDWGPHDISMCIDLLKEKPESVDAKYIRSSGLGNLRSEIISIELRFRQGLNALMTIGNGMQQKQRRMTIEFECESLIFDDLSDQKLRHCNLSGEHVVPVDGPPPLAQACDTFAERIRQNLGGQDDMRLGCQVVQLLETLEVRLAQQN